MISTSKAPTAQATAADKIRLISKPEVLDRVGVTFPAPLGRRQSFKFTYSRGAFTTIGADFDAFDVAYQYLWGGRL